MKTLKSTWPWMVTVLILSALIVLLTLELEAARANERWLSHQLYLAIKGIKP